MMTLDTLTAYYRGLQWGSHINLFSVVHHYTCGEELGGQQLRKQLFFPGSPMGVGPVPTDSTQRSAGALRLRQILYHVINAKKMGLMQSVKGTQGKATRYTITESGRQFVNAGLQQRAEYLRKNATQSIEQACMHAEASRLAALKHFTVLASERRSTIHQSVRATSDNPTALLQQIWGIRLPSVASSVPSRTHMLIGISQMEPATSQDEFELLEMA